MFLIITLFLPQEPNKHVTQINQSDSKASKANKEELGMKDPLERSVNPG